MRKIFFKKSVNSKTVSASKAAMLLAALFVFQNCTFDGKREPAEHQEATEIALAWNRLMLSLERHTPGYRPPVSARAFAYIEMAAYEAVLPSLPGYVSLENFLPGYVRPNTDVAAAQLYMPACLNAAYAQILRDFFPTAPVHLKKRIEQLESEYAHFLGKKTDSQTLDLSVAYGLAVSKSVWEWSATDVEGHDAFLFNYDRDYTPSVCAGCWEPAENRPMPALLPHWDKTRPFVVKPEEIALNDPMPFDETPGSAFHTEAMEVFSVSQPLTKENRWIAELWSDDLPGLTVTSAGRWIVIANQALEKANPPFPLVMETYLKTAIAMCDATILVWHSKYKYNLERPGTYIRRVIKPDWGPLHESPPFPAYPSGHSALGAAAAEVLGACLGEHFTLTDRTHEERQEFAGKPRTYHSFVEMAQENAASRVLLGVHYRMDCVEGLRLGKINGQRAIALPLRAKETAVLFRR